MTKQTIEVDVPNGCEISKIEYFSDSQYIKVRIKEKIQPRRIVLDLTQHEYSLLLKIPIEQRLFDDPVMFDLLRKIQTAEVKETDIPLTTEETKLSFSVDECIEAYSYVQPARISEKMGKFIKENS